MLRPRASSRQDREGWDCAGLGGPTPEIPTTPSQPQLGMVARATATACALAPGGGGGFIMDKILAL